MPSVALVVAVGWFLLGGGGARADLILQLDASSLALANGANVTTWGPASASGTPTFQTGQTPNGAAAVSFNGADHFGQLPAGQFPTTGSGDFIVAAVIRPDNIGAYHNIIDDDASNRPMLWIDSGFNYELNFNGGGGALGVGSGPGGWDIVLADSRNNQLYVNSPTANATGGGGVSYVTPEAFDLFNRDGSQTFRGSVAELRVYNGPVDFGALYNELEAKWFSVAAIPEPTTALALLSLIAASFLRRKTRSLM